MQTTTQTNIQTKINFVNQFKWIDKPDEICKDRAMSLKDRLLQTMKIKGVKPVDLAHAIKVRPSTISAITTGKSLQPRKIREIANFLDTTPEYLQYGRVNAITLPAQGEATADRSLPFLKSVEVVQWLKYGNNSIYRSITVPLPAKLELSKKSYVMDITDESICSYLFPIKIPNMSILAVVDQLFIPEHEQLAILKTPDNQIKLRQRAKDGSEVYYKSFDPQQPNLSPSEVEVGGTIRAIIHLPTTTNT